MKAVSFYNASTYLSVSLLFQIIKSHGCGVPTVELTWEAGEGRNLWEMICLDSGANSATFVVDYGAQSRGG